MKFIKYSKYTGEEGDGIDRQDLMQALSDCLLQSGFQNQFSQNDSEQSLEDLKEAIRQALESGNVQPGDQSQMEEWMEQLQNMTPEQMQQMVDKLAERLQEEGYVSISEPFNKEQSVNHPLTKTRGTAGQPAQQTRAKFEFTDKGLDFL